MGSRSVLLYGQSLLLGVVAASLGQCPELQVSRAATWAEAGELLAKQVPDVLIFDLTAPSQNHLLPLLLKNPHVLMIGLDTESNQGVVVSGQAADSLTLSQIREIAEIGAHRRAGDANNGEAEAA